MFDVLILLAIIATAVILFVLFWTLVASSAPDKIPLRTIRNMRTALDAAVVVDALTLVAMLVIHLLAN